jgi:hypothetical protein
MLTLTLTLILMLALTLMLTPALNNPSAWTYYCIESTTFRIRVNHPIKTYDSIEWRLQANMALKELKGELLTALGCVRELLVLCKGCLTCSLKTQTHTLITRPTDPSSLYGSHHQGQSPSHPVSCITPSAYLYALGPSCPHQNSQSSPRP